MSLCLLSGSSGDNKMDFVFKGKIMLPPSTIHSWHRQGTNFYFDNIYLSLLLLGRQTF